MPLLRMFPAGKVAERNRQHTDHLCSYTKVEDSRKHAVFQPGIKDAPAERLKFSLNFGRSELLIFRVEGPREVPRFVPIF